MTQQHPDLAEEQAYIDHAYDCLEQSRTDAWKLRDLSEATLGGTFQARYERDGEDYKLVHGFVWSLADPARGGPPLRELAASQREHLAREGWVASTSSLGEPGVVEFRLASALIDRPGVRWGAGYLEGGEGPESLRHFPPGSHPNLMADDEVALLAGSPPLRVHPPDAEPRSGAVPSSAAAPRPANAPAAPAEPSAGRV